MEELDNDRVEGVMDEGTQEYRIGKIVEGVENGWAELMEVVVTKDGEGSISMITVIRHKKSGEMLRVLDEDVAEMKRRGLIEMEGGMH